MTHPNILNSSSSVLVVIDVQEAFRTVINDLSEIASRISTAVRGMQALGVPVVITEQYPKGLGPTVEEISMVINADTPIIEKTSFGSCGEPAFVSMLDNMDATQVILCGLETHICVDQTAHGLLENGYDVHLLADCVASRFSKDKETGIAKMTASGVKVSTVEMALFEIMKNSRHEKFKEIQALIK